MVSKARKLLNEQKEFVGEQARVLRQAPGTLVRRAAAKSAEGVRALSKPAQVATRSGLRLTAISQHAADSLLEVQLDIVTAALSNAAEQLDRIARARSLRNLVGGQAEELRAARERIAADIKRVIDILKRAGKGARAVATEALDEVRQPSTRPAAPARRKRAKPAVKRTRRAARKTRG